VCPSLLLINASIWRRRYKSSSHWSRSWALHLLLITDIAPSAPFAFVGPLQWQESVFYMILFVLFLVVQALGAWWDRGRCAQILFCKNQSQIPIWQDCSINCSFFALFLLCFCSFVAFLFAYILMSCSCVNVVLKF
jgi:hypothetical protein